MSQEQFVPDLREKNEGAAVYFVLIRSVDSPRHCDSWQILAQVKNVSWQRDQQQLSGPSALPAPVSFPLQPQSLGQACVRLHGNRRQLPLQVTHGVDFGRPETGMNSS